MTQQNYWFWGSKLLAANQRHDRTTIQPLALCGRRRTLNQRSNRDDALFDGEMNKLGSAVKAKCLHHLILVELNSSGRD